MTEGAAPTPPLRVIQVGIGGWGASWAEQLRRHPELVAPVAYVDVSPTALAGLCERCHVDPTACFGDLDAALAHTAADVVLVTTPLAFHASVAVAALERGLDVIVEKPLASSLDEARAMIDAAERHGRMLAVSQNYRFYPAVRAVTALLRQGAIGPVTGVRVDFRKQANDGPPDTAHHLLAEPLLLDMAIHHFDLMRHVLSARAFSVAGTSWNPPGSRFREPPVALVDVAFEGGVRVGYRGSWISGDRPTLWAGEWAIDGEDGCIRWTARADTTTSLDEVTVIARDGVERRLELEPMPYFDRLGTVHEFASARAEGRDPLTDARDNIATLALTLGSIEACRTGARVTLTDTTTPTPTEVRTAAQAETRQA